MYTAITKDEVKSKYEKDSPPTESEFKVHEESEHETKTETLHPQYLHAVPFMAKEPGVSLNDQQSGETLNIPWEEVIHKHVRTTDNVDIGDVEKVGNGFKVVRE